jgi:glyoxylase-like metal-dependent hydrolase (beta-lactamase superfamily II)/rhodanese-related sulfurtransferase
MYFKQLRLNDMGCASYLLGSARTKEAAVIDPGWNVEAYIKEATTQGFKITYIFETHLHADHVSGNRRLAQLTGANIYVHKLANVAYPHHSLEGGSLITFGEIRLRVLATPGHTWESITLLVEDTSNPSLPLKLLSGDTLFIGDVGRPDFAGETGAGTLFDSLQREIIPLPDSTEIYPAHLAGSLCGRSMSAAPSSLLGVEKHTNPALQINDRAAFINFLTADLPPTPPDFQRIVELNREGSPLEQPLLAELAWKEVQTKLASDIAAVATTEDGVANGERSIQLIDIREPNSFWAGHISKSLNVPPGLSQFGAHVALFVNSATPIVLVANTLTEVERAQTALGVVGRSNLLGFILFSNVATTTASALTTANHRIEASTLRARQLEDKAAMPLLLDVRDVDEFKVDGIATALNIPLRQLPKRLDELETFKNQTLVVICKAGNRSSLATSYLLSLGWNKVLNLRGGMDAYNIATFAHKPDESKNY